MALARFRVPVLDVCAGVWYAPHDALGVRDEIASVCGCSASSSSWYHGKWRQSQLLLGPSAGLLLPSVSVANLRGENSFSWRIVRPRSPPSPISIGRVFLRGRKWTCLRGTRPHVTAVEIFRAHGDEFSRRAGEPSGTGQAAVLHSRPVFGPRRRRQHRNTPVSPVPSAVCTASVVLTRLRCHGPKLLTEAHRFVSDLGFKPGPTPRSVAEH